MTPDTDTSTQANRSALRFLLARLPVVVLAAILALMFPFPSSAAAADFTALQWAHQAIHLPQAWKLVPDRGAGTTVCDVDSGVMTSHLDLKDAIVGGVNTADALTPGSYSDDDGHGTYTAGIMVARGRNIWGVAPGASLLVAKVLTGGSGGTMSVNAGILWCVHRGAKVINLSLGTPATRWDGIAEAIAYGCSQGVDFAVASGNERTTAAALNPATVDSPCLIAVNASDRQDRLAGFSNMGENQRTVTAPGQVIVSDWTSGGVTLGSGTSASAPMVAGVMALLRSQGADARTAVNVILMSARHPKQARFVHGRNDQLGYGILDAGTSCQRYWKVKDRITTMHSEGPK